MGASLRPVEHRQSPMSVPALYSQQRCCEMLAMDRVYAYAGDELLRPGAWVMPMKMQSGFIDHYACTG